MKHQTANNLVDTIRRNGVEPKTIVTTVTTVEHSDGRAEEHGTTIKYGYRGQGVIVGVTDSAITREVGAAYLLTQVTTEDYDGSERARIEGARLTKSGERQIGTAHQVFAAEVIVLEVGRDIERSRV